MPAPIETLKRGLAALLIFATLALPGAAGAARAADRFGRPTTSLAPRVVESARSGAVLAAERMYARNVDPTTALLVMIQDHGLDLVAAERALADAAYSQGERTGAVRDVYNAPSAAAEVSRSGASTTDTYMQLRCWQHSTVESAGAIIDTVDSATPEETAWAMVADGATPEQIVDFLRYAGWTVEEIVLFLEQTGLYAAERILAALLRGIAVASDATEAELAVIFTMLRQLFSKADAAGDFLIETLGASWERAAELLLQAGYAGDKIADWLKRVIGLSAQRIAKFLKQKAGMGADQVFSVLAALGYKLEAVAEAVVGLFGISAQKLAKLLKAAGASVARAIAVLLHRFGPAIAGQLQNLLLKAKYGLADVQGGLNDLFAMQMQMMQEAMTGG